ncbi:MAG: D-tyrosyl-tRNA(Tyr) deacylase [Porticoccus sp.]|jgi:D-aminoacyl-tRNA deacylase|uniref:D-aminoacyl-tRNA deacylase n=1 Tax=Porticoccus hydrocarbonoclasticus TaxID=1073414 RepID=UPI0005656F31|nr:D-aminoacyl-tRNA deacylase [Porticoccus hydrocarbonoclasticus]MBG57169.1 D-tyrosyl-tRNA(Tyr) deacylase [Porticoccus sp.]|tara:strand:+ start:13073 stop:13510 length:438 start_codon:yes stop_codon:yes gene_type:complete
MLGLIQRVSYATVEVNGDRVGEIGPGLLLLLGVQAGDSEETAARLLHKVLNYRIFPDDGNRMNLNLQQMGGGLMVVSQFTLAADTGKGLRPGFSNAAPPERAEALYDYFLSRAEHLYSDVASGIFGANMQVSLCNDGPVTFMLEG